MEVTNLLPNGVFIVNFEHILRLVLVLHLVIVNSEDVIAGYNHSQNI